jgi:hypothetical protein
MNEQKTAQTAQVGQVTDEWAGIEQSYREHQERQEALLEQQREQALEDLAEQEQRAGNYNVANDYVNNLKDGHNGIIAEFDAAGAAFRNQITCDMLNYGRSYKKAILKMRPEPGNSALLFFEAARFIYWAKIPGGYTDVERTLFFQQNQPKLRAAAKSNIVDFMVMLTVLPELADWAGLSGSEIEILGDRLLASHMQALVHQKTGQLYGLGDENN